MIDPGDILKDVRIDRIDYRGNGYFDVGQQKFCVEPKDAPAAKLEKGSVLDRVVCTGKKLRNQCIKCSTCNYQADLINELYFHKGHRYKHFMRATQSAVWLKRWYGIADKVDQAKCHAINPDALPKVFDSSLQQAVPVGFPGKRWKMLSTTTWEMPVLVTDVMDQMKGESRFCPTALSKLTQSDRIGLSPCYRADMPKDTFPILFDGRLRYSPESKSSRVKIYLHGYLDPRKWHHNIWYHLLAASPSVRRPDEERTFWGKLLATSAMEVSKMLSTVHQQEINEIFLKCNENRDGKYPKCKLCAEDVFIQVNTRIQSLMQCYLERVVTFFESETTKDLKITPIIGVEPYIKKIEVYLCRKVSFELGEENIVQWHFVDLRGFIFQRNSDVQIIHIAPVTQYLSDARKEFGEEISVLRPKRGEIVDVQRSIRS